jgi:hypothetical protein
LYNYSIDIIGERKMITKINISMSDDKMCFEPSQSKNECVDGWIIIKNVISQHLNNLNINFLFGAGINAGVLPLAEELEKTKKLIIKNGGKKDSENSVEKQISDILDDCDESKFEKTLRDFENAIIEDIKTEYGELDDNSKENYANKQKNLGKISNLIYVLRNFMVNSNRSIRNNKLRIDIWSLNYDDLFLDLLNKANTPYFAIDGTYKNYERLNYTIYDENKHKTLMTLHYTKLHGNLTYPIIPSSYKYNKILSRDNHINYFETFIKFKEYLVNYQGVLIVIGYSWSDDHVNNVIKDFLKTGNILIVFSYSNKDTNKMDKVFNNSTDNVVYSIYEFMCEENDSRDVLSNLLSQCFDLSELINANDDTNKMNDVRVVNNDGNSVNE